MMTGICNRAMLVTALVVTAIMLSAVPMLAQEPPAFGRGRASQPPRASVSGNSSQDLRVFVSARTTEGDMDDWSQADILCQARANKAGLGGTWLAWLSTTTFNAPDRIPDARYVRIDGQVVANSLAELTNGSSLINPINVDSNGLTVPSSHVWTGTHANGTLGVNNCNDWKDNKVEGGYGITDGALGMWTDVGAEFCTIKNRLYCFEIIAPPAAMADLALVKTVDNSTPALGEQFVFTVTLTNDGPDGASGIVVSDPQPTGLSYSGGVASQGTYTPGTGVWSVGSLASGASATLDITATASQLGTLTNTADVDSLNETDPNLSNNTASAEVTVEEVTTKTVDLGLSMTVDSSTPTLHQEVEFTVTLTNNGPDGGTGIEVSDPQPTGLTFVSAVASQGTFDLGTGVWLVGSLANGPSAKLANGASATLTVKAKTEELGTLTNTATIQALNENDPELSNNTASAQVEVVPAVPSLPGRAWPLVGFLVLLSAGLLAMQRRRRLGGLG